MNFPSIQTKDLSDSQCKNPCVNESENSDNKAMSAYETDMKSECRVSESVNIDINRSKKKRESNLELYRIIVMLLIVTHHYVVNSGLFPLIESAPLTASSITMLLLGAWGKTGINCFVLITGYFMCKSKISWQKLLKLYLQILFYCVIIYAVFAATGYEKLSVVGILKTLSPIKDLSPNDFVSCFIAFYLFIPFLNILIGNLDKRKHAVLIALMVVFYSILPSALINIPLNYIGWFSVLYIISSYIRLYGMPLSLSTVQWGITSLILVIAGGVSVILMVWTYAKNIISVWNPYWFVSDSNKVLSLATGISSFMFFLKLHIPYSRIINILGAATFGVLLIHANSEAMRTWLWRDTIDCVGNFGNSVLWTLGYALECVCMIFVVCAGIDWFRKKLIEPSLMKVAERFIDRLYALYRKRIRCKY